MPDHDGPGLIAEAREGNEVALDERIERDIDDGCAVVRIGGSDSDSGEMFEARAGAGRMQTAHEGAGEIDHSFRIAAECSPLESLRRLPAADVDHRREIDLDVEVPQRHADDLPHPRGKFDRLIAFAERFRARQAGDEMPQPIDASTLFVDHERWRPLRDRFLFADEIGELLAADTELPGNVSDAEAERLEAIMSDRKSGMRRALHPKRHGASARADRDPTPKIDKSGFSHPK